MDTSKSAVLNTIVGFVYFVGIFFGFLFHLNIRSLIFVSESLPYAPYIVIIIIPISYLLGLMAYLFVNDIFVRKIVLRKNKYEPTADYYLLQHASQPLLNLVQTHIGLFLAVRVLIIGLFILSIYSSLWIIRSGLGFGVRNLIGFYVLILLTIFVYFRLRINVRNITQNAVDFIKTDRENNNCNLTSGSS